MCLHVCAYTPQDFCISVLVDLMCIETMTFKEKTQLLYAMLLRVQAAANNRHCDLVSTTWADVGHEKAYNSDIDIQYTDQVNLKPLYEKGMKACIHHLTHTICACVSAYQVDVCA